MPVKQTITYNAEFGGNEPSSISAPDTFYFSSQDKIKRPKKRFVISRDKLGNVLSYYGDDTWDFGPYIYAGNSSAFKVHFEKLPKSYISDSKWIVFILLYMVDTGRATGLTAGSILDYMKPVRCLVSYSDSNNIKITQVLSNENHLSKFTLTLKTKGKLTQFAGLISHLSRLGVKRTGIKVLTGLNIDAIRQRAYLMEPDKQHPVIPPRIFSEIVNGLHSYINLIMQDLCNIEAFIKKILIDEKFARCRTIQRRLGYKNDKLGPFFDGSAKQYKLDTLFKKLKVHSLQNLSTFITRTQHACKLIIHIYSGMRNAEAISLKTGCLKKEILNHKPSYRLSGATSKLVGQEKSASWVTSEAVVGPIRILESIALIIGNCISLKSSETPIFISPTYLGIASSSKPPNKYINISKTGIKSQEIFSYLDTEILRINSADLDYLEKIDPFRAWRTEDAFKVGAIWRFTTHQFRRSMAFYVLQSGLVSLPALKRQLKHISREMTIYYSQAHELENIFNKKNHISHMIRKIKPEVDALAYLHEVLLSDEPLYGAGGKFIEKNKSSNNNIPLFKEDRYKLDLQFKKGELAYKTTPLGACTSSQPCHEKASRSVTACVSCERSVIKLTKLDKVIELQNVFVNELRTNDDQSLEFRTETSELNILKSFRDRVSSKGNQ